MRGAHGHRKKVSECVRQLCPWTTRCLYKPDGGSQEMKCRYCAETCVLWTKSSCPPLEKNALEIHKAFMLPCPTERFAYTAGIPWNRKITSPTQNMESIVKTRPQECIACNEAKQRDKSHGGKLVSAASSQPIHQCLDGSQNTGFRHQEAKLPQEYRQER